MGPPCPSGHRLRRHDAPLGYSSPPGPARTVTTPAPTVAGIPSTSMRPGRCGSGPGAALRRLAPEPGYSRLASDCARGGHALEAGVYAWRDADGDGATVAETGQLCIGHSLPVATSSRGATSDCDDTNASVRRHLEPLPTRTATGGPPLQRDAVRGHHPPAATRTRHRLRARQRLALAGPHLPVPRCRRGLLHRAAGAPSAPTAPCPPLHESSKGNDCDDTGRPYQASRAGWTRTRTRGSEAPPTSAPPAPCPPATPPPARLRSQRRAAWQSLPFQYRDADGDAAPPSSGLCAPAAPCLRLRHPLLRQRLRRLPPPLFLWRVLYPDKDGWLGGPSRVVLCLDTGPAPPGYSISGLIADDSQPGVASPPRPGAEAILLGG